MISLFEKYPKENPGVVFPANWEYIRASYLKNLTHVKAYYKAFPQVLNSDHFLTRLIETISVPNGLSLKQYYDSVNSLALNIGMVFRMTSEQSKGHIHREIFYGEGSAEILLAVDDYFDFHYVNHHWKDVCAVYPILHPKSDMNLMLPNGHRYSNEDGLSVFVINIPMLMIQHRAFLNSQTPSTQKTTTQFIASYVLPNMLDKHLELALFNRIYKTAYGKDDGANEVFKKHSFYIPDYLSYLDIAIVRVLENIQLQPLIFDTILKTLPSFRSTNLYQELVLPDITPTMNVDWILTVSRLKVVDFLLKQSSIYASIKNQAEINQIIRTYHINSVNSMIGEMLPSKIVDELDSYKRQLMDSNKKNFI